MEQESLAVPPAPCSPLPAMYVTFINPQEIKGVYVFARIARELARGGGRIFHCWSRKAAVGAMP